MEEKSKRSTIFKNIFFGIILVALLLILSNLVLSGLKQDKLNNNVEEKVTFELENYGKIVIKLYPDKAPNTVNNFLNLVASGYYNNKVVYGKDINTIHFGRNENGENIPAKKSNIDSSIKKDSTEDKAYGIKGEFVENNVNNDLQHSKYMVSMARANYTQLIQGLKRESYDSGNALFNIVTKDGAHELDGKYAVFGEVIEGQEIIDEITKRELKEEITKENILDLIGFKEYIKIKSATSNVTTLRKVKYEDLFNLEDYLTKSLKNNSNNNLNTTIRTNTITNTNN